MSQQEGDSKLEENAELCGLAEATSVSTLSILSSAISLDNKNDECRNVLCLSLSFFIMFCAMNSVLIFGTSDYGNYAAISLSITYFAFCLSSLFIVPYILNNSILSCKYCIFYGSLGGILLVSDYIRFINEYYLYFVSIIQGISAAMLWIGSQQYIIKCARKYELKSELTKNSTIPLFECILLSFTSCSVFVSSIISGILFQINLSNDTVYSIFTIICSIGCCIILIIDKNIDIQTEYISSAFFQTDSFFSTIQMWKTQKLQCMVPMSLYLGLYLDFEYGIFPTLIKNKSLKFYIMACYGLSGAASAAYLGKISNVVNRYYIISIAALINVGVYGYILYLNHIDDEVIFSLFIIAILNGMVESSFLVTLYSLYPIICGNNSETFSNAQFFQQFGLALGFIFYSIFNCSARIIFDLVILCIALIIFFKSSIVRKYINHKHEIIDIDNQNNYDTEMKMKTHPIA